MVKAGIIVKKKGPGGYEVRKRLKELSKARVLVGIPEKSTDRKDGTITNAQLLFIHTNGSPVNNIPARPLIEPAINDPTNKKSITAELKQAALAALNGKKQVMYQFFRRAGMDAKNRIKAWFVDPKNHWPPNAPSTIARKGSDKPMIDTSQLRNHIDYILDKDGSHR